MNESFEPTLSCSWSSWSFARLCSLLSLGISDILQTTGGNTTRRFSSHSSSGISSGTPRTCDTANICDFWRMYFNFWPIAKVCYLNIFLWAKNGIVVQNNEPQLKNVNTFQYFPRACKFFESLQYVHSSERGQLRGINIPSFKKCF